MKKLLPLTLLLFCSFILNAQGNVIGKKKVYKAWVKQANSNLVAKGILYEIGDSSVFLVPTLYSGQIKEFHAESIDLLKIRGVKSIERAMMIGSVVGFGTGAAIGYTISDFPFLRHLTAFGSGIVFGAIGMGIGALVGSVKDRFPVRNSFESFEKYKGSLQSHSFLDEKPILSKFVHRGYISLSTGFSNSGSEFINKVPFENYRGMNMSGEGFKGEVGYFFTSRVGVNWKSQQSRYSVKGDDSTMFWGFHSELIGPVFSFFATDKFRFDINPSAGYSSAFLYSDELEFYTGHGFGLNFSGKIAYIVSKRWNVAASISYTSSKQRYVQGGSGKAKALDVFIGLDYKFGKKSL